LFPLLPAVGRLFAPAGGTGFFERLLDRFAGFPGALLNPANKLFPLALGVLEIVIRELGPFLFQLAFGDVPVAFNFEFVHNNAFCCFLGIRRQRDGKGVLVALVWLCGLGACPFFIQMDLKQVAVSTLMFFGATARGSAAKQYNYNDDNEKKANRTAANIEGTGKKR
jgi:hypothetical protein